MVILIMPNTGNTDATKSGFYSLLLGMVAFGALDNVTLLSLF